MRGLRGLLDPDPLGAGGGHLLGGLGGELLGHGAALGFGARVNGLFLGGLLGGLTALHGLDGGGLRLRGLQCVRRGGLLGSLPSDVCGPCSLAHLPGRPVELTP